MTHELKTWSEHFEEVFMGRKTYEVRKNDRDFKVGDMLILQEGDLGGAGMSDYDLTFFPTGRTLARKVTHILHGGEFGIEKDYVVMSIQ